MTKSERHQRWRTVEHGRSMACAREMIEACQNRPDSSPCYDDTGCMCPMFRAKNCPARRYLESCEQPDAWEHPNKSKPSKGPANNVFVYG